MFSLYIFYVLIFIQVLRATAYEINLRCEFEFPAFHDHLELKYLTLQSQMLNVHMQFYVLVK